MSKPKEIHQGNTFPAPTHSEISSLEIIDLDLPIAVRKGVRSCTQHPIRKFVSYDILSLNYRAFVQYLTTFKYQGIYKRHYKTQSGQ